MERADTEAWRAHYAILHGIRAEHWSCGKSQSNIAIFPHCNQSRLILRASTEESTNNLILAALALKEDTIPKPDGLAMVTKSADIERNSYNVEQCSKMIEDCSHSVRESM